MISNHFTSRGWRRVVGSAAVILMVTAVAACSEDDETEALEQELAEVTEDGSQGEVLWMWYGTNAEGNPFELAGVTLITYNQEGLISYEYVTYPYDDDYVYVAVLGDGTSISPR